MSQIPTFIITPAMHDATRQRNSCWLRWFFATSFKVPYGNVSVVYNDDQESTTVHVACTCKDRHIVTFTSWAGSDDDDFRFYAAAHSSKFYFDPIRVPFPPEPDLLRQMI